MILSSAPKLVYSPEFPLLQGHENNPLCGLGVKYLLCGKENAVFFDFAVYNLQAVVTIRVFFRLYSGVRKNH